MTDGTAGRTVGAIGALWQDANVPAATAADPWDAVVGQDRAAAQLRAAARAPVHAYLLVGQEGWGGRALARAFAADVLSVGLAPDEAERVGRLVAEGGYADVATVEPEGNQLRKDEVDELIRLAHRQPTERPRKILVLPRFDSAGPVAWSRMLKVLEEPPPTTIWILLADDLPAEMATIASRTVIVRLEPVPPALVAERLVAEGADAAAADIASAAAAGDLGLARLLAGDARLALRVEGWRTVPEELDGTGHAVWRAVAERRAAIDDALAHVKAGFDAAEVELAARIEELHLPKGRLKELNESHKRQLRRARTAELRLGLAALAARYRDALTRGHGRRTELADAVSTIDFTYEAIHVRNANEALQLQALFLKLPPLRSQ